MDSSKAKRRGSGYPGGEAAAHGTDKNKMRIFAEIPQSGGKIFC
jgi:hypothetical protein